MDAAHDATENFVVLTEGIETHPAGIDFVVKWNPRARLMEEEKDHWCQQANKTKAWQTKEGYQG